MSMESEQSEDIYKELRELRKQLEEKYNINLDTETDVGGKTFWDLMEYFTKEIKRDNLLIPSDLATMCCHRTDIVAMNEEFNKQLNEFVKYESNEVCEDTHAELLESAVGHPCPYAFSTSSLIVRRK